MRNGRTLCARTLKICLGIGIGVGIAATAGADSFDRIGVRNATLAWSEADGLVDGYLIYTRRDGGPTVFESFSQDNRYTIMGDLDEQVVLEVKAVGRSTPGGPLIASDFSEPSLPVRFHATGLWDSSAIAVMRSDRTDDVRMHLFRNGNIRYQVPGRAAPWEPLAAGDFMGDLQHELLWQHSVTGALELASLNAPNATLGAATGDLTTQVVEGVGDLDGDGDLDLLMYDLSNLRVRVWRASSSGAIQRSTLLDAVPGADIIGIADFGADGAEDVWTFNRTTGRLEVFAADERPNPLTSAPLEDLGTVDRVEDFDGDGAPDLLWRRPGGAFAISYLHPDGRTRRSVSYPVTAFDSHLEVVGVAPLTTQGGLELVLINQIDGSMWVMFPSYEIAGNRFKILDSDGERFEPFTILR